MKLEQQKWIPQDCFSSFFLLSWTLLLLPQPKSMKVYALLQLISAGDVPVLAPILMAAATKKTSTTSSPASLPTPQSITGFIIPLWDKTPTTLMQLHCVEEMHVTLDACHTCINQSRQLLFQNCSYQKEAILWAEPCMVRYSSMLIFGIEEDEPIKYVPSPTDAANLEQFKPRLNSLLDTLSEKAASGDSLKKYAAGHTTLQGVPTYQAIYALVQCTPDMDKTKCSNCLQNAISKIQACCPTRQGARIIKPSCFVRFEADRFYESTADSEVSLPPIKGKKGNISKTTIIIIIVAVIAFILTLLVSICIFFRVRKRRVKLKLENSDNNSDEISLEESLQYDFETIRAATEDFSDENKLGQGGFGIVYKGQLANGQYIAVKWLFKNSEQGDREFKNEVTLVAQLQHRNLVRLLGFCLKGKERILIYEYVPNTSLNHFIFDPINHGHLDWETRYKIIAGIARGILYLHEDSRLRIIHRDLKPSNILLDEDMNPKIADFGMARLFLMDQTEEDTKTIVGTHGYMAPEYAIHGRFSVKSDVFSFGVLVLEIVSGKKVGTFRNGENEEDFLSYVDNIGFTAVSTDESKSSGYASRNEASITEPYPR